MNATEKQINKEKLQKLLEGLTNQELSALKVLIMLRQAGIKSVPTKLVTA